MATLPSAVASVAITLRSQPDGAEIYWNDQKLGNAPGPLYLPQGEQAQTLLVRAPRYTPSRVVVVPSQDRTVTVVLVPRAPRPSGTVVPSDLENPY